MKVKDKQIFKGQITKHIILNVKEIKRRADHLHQKCFPQKLIYIIVQMKSELLYGSRLYSHTTAPPEGMKESIFMLSASGCYYNKWMCLTKYVLCAP